MPSTMRRRPLPALAFLLALTVVTAVVWWRVLHRSTNSESSTCPAPTTSSVAGVATTLPTPGSVTVVVLNGTSRAGIAGKARDALLAAGFRSPDQQANDTHQVIGVAEIRYTPAQAKAAHLLAYWFPSARLRATASAGGKVVVSLGKGYRQISTQKQVDAALARDHVVLRDTPVATPSASSASVSC